MVLIDQIFSREILDSRGNPTLETTVVLTNGLKANFSVPAGASRGTHEAWELRDQDYGRFAGMGVLHAIDNVNKIIAPRLKKMNPLEQDKVDKILLELDQTTNKAHLGANSVLSISMAVSRVTALLLKKNLYLYINELFRRQKSLNQFEEPVTLTQDLLQPRLPVPCFNLINGGKHADNPLAFQEYLLIPNGVEKTKERVRAAVEIGRILKKDLIENKYAVSLGDEGGFAPNLPSDSRALDFITESVKKSGYTIGKQVVLGLDIAASTFFKEGIYNLPLENFMGKGEELAALYESLIEKYNLLFIEDPFAEDDWESWSKFQKRTGRLGRLAGDDLVVTSRALLIKAHEKEALNSVIVKPNQVGTLTETLQFVKIAKSFNYSICVSHRSGETNDDFIVDLAVGVGADFMKAGAPVRGERVAKYNRLMQIAEEIE